MTHKALEVGDTIFVMDSEDNDPTGEWLEVKVRSIKILYNPSSTGKLRPYICVGVDSSNLCCFAYEIYCEYDWVRLEKPV